MTYLQAQNCTTVTYYQWILMSRRPYTLFLIVDSDLVDIFVMYIFPIPIQLCLAINGYHFVAF